MTAALWLYESALISRTEIGQSAYDGLHLRYADGRRRPMALGQWCAAADPVDLDLLSRCADPTLDAGCGPGRLVTALATAGRCALGVDVAAAAVEIARLAGATALRQSVFDPLPDEGGWGTVLLADGNIGIGGEPVQLLRRCRQLLAAEGQVLVELDPPGSTTDRVTVRLEAVREHSDWFTWAHVAADDIERPARLAGLRVIDCWTMGGRWFSCLAR